jgi:uncharacterized protein with LGFP repeats/glucose/arabinose dehydrogenase
VSSCDFATNGWGFGVFQGFRRSIAGAAIAATTATLLVTLPPVVAGAVPTLPQDFLLRDVTTGLSPSDQLTDFAYLPDESLLSVGKTGRVMYAPLTGAPREVARISTNTTGDLGLTGLAVAPDYATSHTIYTARTVPGTGAGAGRFGFLRLSKWTVTTAPDGGPQGLAAEQVLVQTSADSEAHGISGVVAAEDGTVWVSIGDSADYRVVDRLALRALNPDDPHGKLMHLRPDGTGVPTNPGFNASAPRSVRSLSYASGLRSPFRFSVDAATGRPMVGEVGWNDIEEINLVNPGGNYGWPCWEGTFPTWGYRDLPECANTTTASPLWSYPHRGGGSVTGGVVYTGSVYPAEYRGRYFFGDYVFRKLFTLRTNERGDLVTPPEPNGFGSDIGYPVKFGAVPTGGDIVYGDIVSGKLRRLVYAPGNNPPQAVINSTNDPATRTVTFDGRDSTDPNGDPLTYRWNFGDGTPEADGAVVTHTYAAGPESFTATLTVSDPLSAAGAATTTVHPSNHAPVLTVQAPPGDATFAVGDTVSATATATDAEDGAQQVSWSVTLVHCAGVSVCHNHPGEHQEGPTFTLQFDGHPGDSRLEVTASATDSRGAVTKQTFVVHPRQRRVTIETNHPAAFVIGDQPATSGLFTVGSHLSIIAPATAVDGVATFDRWGDGSTNRVRELTLPDADQVISVSYLTPIDRRYAGDAAMRARIGTPLGAEQGDVTVRWRDHTGGRIYWSPDTGVHWITGYIALAYLNAGGHLRFGIPTTDETALSDGRGAFNHFTGGRSIYWTAQTGAHLISGPIRDKWASMGWELSVLGYPVTNETPINGGAFVHFERGSLYWTAGTGAHEVRGFIREKWANLGWENSVLGYPTTDELGTPDGVGRFNHFQGGSIYWTPSTGAHEVHGDIRGKWQALGWENSVLGYPTTDETATPDGIGRFNHFQAGSIYWTQGTGAHEVHGAIRGLWQSLGWENSVLRYPLTDELATPDGVGRYAHFQGGSVYWTAATGAHEIHGAIKAKWASLDWERSFLGYPTSNEFAIPGGARSNFQGGYITWSAATGVATAFPW